MKKTLLSATILSLVVACSGVKKNYVIVDNSYSPKPKWVKKEHYEPSKKDEYKYFISKAENVNQRLCESTASARANLVVASEIANNIDNAFKNTINSNDDEANTITTEKLQQTVKLQLAGVENTERYWERRQYLKKLGAEEDKTRYQCYSLLRMKKDSYNKAVDASLNKMMSMINSDNKQEIINNVKDKLLEQDENI